MTTATVRRCFSIVLTCFACWPLVHFVLTQTIEINPWKLFGLAMYSSRYRVTVELRDESKDPAVVLEPQALGPSTQRAIEDLRRWRGTLGKVVDIAPFADRILEDNPHVQRLAIRFGVKRFDTSTSTLKTSWATHTYAAKPLVLPAEESNASN